MTAREVRSLPMPAGPAVLDVVPLLAAALDGSGPAVLPTVPDGRSGTTTLDDRSDRAGIDPIAVVLATSGSTGDAKQVLLPASALRASADATRQRLGGSAGWLLTLPAWHIAGLQVLLRAAGAGAPVVAMDLDTSFTADGFAAAALKLTTERRHVSLVPTQLHRILDDPRATAVLAAFDAVLVGGAATPPALQERARAVGIRIVTTYGMSETCGGCVYDGVPLDGVQVALTDGRIVLSGAVIARGYRDAPDHPAFPRPGTFVTDDVGDLDGGLDSDLQGRVLTVLGRADDVIVTGGLKVPPAPVERALSGIAGIGEVLVVGVPDPEWGQIVVGLVTGTVPSGDLVRRALTALPRHHRPRRWVRVEELPLRGPGKPDRRAAAWMADRSSQ